MKRVDARLDITTDGWATCTSTPVSGKYEDLRAVLKALDAISTDAMLSCNCGVYPYGECETCNQPEPEAAPRGWDSVGPGETVNEPVCARCGLGKEAVSRERERILGGVDPVVAGAFVQWKVACCQVRAGGAV